MAKLSLPSKKILAVHLQKATSNDQSEAAGLRVWQLSPDGYNNIQLSLAWLQGTVTEVKKDETSFLLDDTSGVIQVCKSSAVVQACSELSAGKYVLVIGELLSSGNLPVVKAIKIQNLSDEPVLQDMWKYEVQDFLNYSAATPSQL